MKRMQADVSGIFLSRMIIEGAQLEKEILTYIFGKELKSVLEEVGIDESRRVRGLGVRQKEALLKKLAK